MGFLSAFTKRPLGDCQQSVEKFSGVITAYLGRLEAEGGDLHERSMTLIARSPSAAAARALTLHSAELQRHQVSVRLIFAKLSPMELLTELATALNLTAPREGSAGAVRLIKTPALLAAHEQLVLGRDCCWTGDMLRRSEENRNGLNLFEEAAPGSVRLAQFAFDAIWTIAKPVPARIMAGSSRLFADRAPLTPAVAAAGLADGSPLQRMTRGFITRH